MDAASHNSVDDIRELRESVAFAPVSGRSKVYILDEAHMLTPQAWNAFLKTLEEPPPNTIFVLATTEAQKVLPTVVDRCHRFDFTRPTVEQLSAVLRRVAGQEGIEIAPDALALLARHATGSFRDALGTLEQLVTYTGTQIAVADVLAVLGAVDDDLLFGALDAVATHDAAQALRAAAGLAATGRDLTSATRDLEVHARELLVVGTLGDVPAELRVTADRDARLLEQARRVPEGDVVRLLDLLGASLRAAKDGADPRTQLELALVKAAAPEVDASTKALLARIARLEAALDGGATPAPAPPAPAPPAATEPAPAAAPPPVTPAARASEHAAAPAPPPPPGPAQPSSAVPVAPVAVAVAEPEPAPPPAPATPPAPGRALTIEELREVWPAVLETIAEDFSLLAAALGNAHPAEITDGALIVAFAQDDSFNRRMAAESADHRRVLGEALQALTGVRLRLAYELRDLGGVPAGPPPLAGEELVARIVQEFDAEEIVPEAVADPDPEGPA
ncbi:MAG: hypothetical protein MUC84_11555 [Solirubrobacteraceae bacterium]|nr:hypothetical protein [Solirubrobacteraceae bacterium]